MKLTRHRHLRSAAFSLPEVTIAMGIVAMLMLPALAMLAGGGSMEVLARDREMASCIVREVVSGVRPGEGGDHFVIDFAAGPSLRLDLPAPDAGKTVYALFDETGRYLGEVGEGDYEKGVDSSGGGVHLVRLQLSVGKAGRNSSLLEWELSVGQPATAAREVRSVEVFQTRLSLP
jgi:hypothetical protein